MRKLHDEIKKMTGLEDDEFWIEVTGGDRERKQGRKSLTNITLRQIQISCCRKK